MQKIKIGFIGLGRMGITHLSIINSNPKVNVTSVCDPSKVINLFFKKYFENIKLYSEFEELIEKENPDGVIVSTPPNFHFKIVKICLEKGIHCFVEKPFTLSYEESKELSELAGYKKVVNQVGYVNRFNDIFVNAKALIEGGVIGKVIRFKSEMFSYTISKEDKGEGWRANLETGGGCLNEMASHAIDLVNYLVGVPAMVSGSVLNKVYSQNVEDIVSTTFKYNEDLAGTLYVNWCDPSFRKPANKIEIFGKEGKILVDQHDLKIFLKNPNKTFNFKKGWNTVYITDIFNNVPFYVRGNEFTSQLYHFIDCIENRDLKNKCTFKDAVETQKILNLIRFDYKNNEVKNGKN